MDKNGCERASAIDSWERVARFYLNLVSCGGDLVPMVDFVDRIGASRYAAGIYGRTSMATLWIERHPDIDWQRGEFLKIDFSDARFMFRYQESAFSAACWEKQCDRGRVFGTFEHVIHRLKWYSD